MSNRRRFNCLFVAIVILGSSLTIAATHWVRSADDVEALLESNRLLPGDEIVWKNGIAADEEVDLVGVDGNASHPITFRAESPGKVILHGESQFKIGAQHWVIKGFHFEGKSGESNAYSSFQFRSNDGTESHYCKLTDCAFTNLTTDEETSKWILLFGTHNVIEKCFFGGKNSKGAMVTVELGSLSQHASAGHRIESNYFGDFRRQPGNENETIRIGFSGDQNKRAKCVVKNNLFERCDGENEVISNKSSYNVFAFNTFRRCNGALVLRHGHHAVVDSNCFLGEGASGTGGIRISDSGHVIVNNYFHGLAGTEWNAALSILGGKKQSGGTSNGYQAVAGIVVIHNSILNCRQSIFLNNRKGKNALGGLFANNIISSDDCPLVSGKLSAEKLVWKGNLWHGDDIGLRIGNCVDLELEVSKGLLRPTTSGPAVDAALDVAESPTHDIEGQRRPGKKRDVGADELLPDGSPVTNRPLEFADVGVSFQLPKSALGQK